MIQWKPKHRNCKVCRTRFFTDSPRVTWCSDACCDAIVADALAKVRAKRDKQARKDHRKAREAVKTLPELRREAQAACNAYVRERDKGKPCISCGRPDDGTHQRHAGHWKTTKARPDIRYEASQIHACCFQCNVYGGGGLHEGYLPELIRRVGQSEVDRLQVTTVRKYSREELEAIKAHYRAETNRLRRNRSSADVAQSCE